MLQPYFSEVKTIKERSSGINHLKGFSRFQGENPLWNMITDIFPYYIKTDISVINNGGRRANITEGHIAYGDIYCVLAFDNKLTILSLKGALVKKLLSLVAERRRYSLAGIMFEARGNKVSNIMVKGLPLADEKVYTVAANDYPASGESKFNTLGILDDCIHIDNENILLRDIITNTLEENGVDIHPLDHYDKSNPRQRYLD